MSELKKMRNGQTYNCLDQELAEIRDQAFTLLFKFNHEADSKKRAELLKQTGAQVPDSSYIAPPLEMSYACHLSLGENSYINSGALILDNGKVTIGNHVMIGPRVQIYTAAHSLDAGERIAGDEVAKPVTIEDKVWIGGGAIILPGITVAEGAIVGAGSVVTKDVKPYDRVAGNPAKSIKK
ncbi:sugar O-acetyltransferase [Vibrio sp. SCSIO 43137]|uniref:sugar O-acetyltransferase n=1 Tax=Vibrio sp. SCSIO 43137 TaxID=3021011 RepID=UPI002306F139|nr:sugar O-acetyltransferase [Vibrio sp. SCSIO 43137]WCE29335.1 sugar O-acetyltransferase [Vibrio sp. SCSIO 43137]